MTDTNADSQKPTTSQQTVLPEGHAYWPRAIDPATNPAGAHLQAMEAARYRYAIDHGLILFDTARTALSNRAQADVEIDKRILALPGAPAIPAPTYSPSTVKPADAAQAHVKRLPLRHQDPYRFAVTVLGSVIAIVLGAWCATDALLTTKRPAVAKPIYELNCGTVKA